MGYEHRAVNHSINFKDPITGEHTNTIESTWNHVKIFLGQYNRGGLPLSGTLPIRGEVQGRRDTNVTKVPASRREHRLVAVPSYCLLPTHHGILHQGKTTFQYFEFIYRVTPRTIAAREARVADCERSSLSFSALH